MTEWGIVGYAVVFIIGLIGTLGMNQFLGHYARTQHRESLREINALIFRIERGSPSESRPHDYNSGTRNRGCG
jgi:hypothetical protein